jgi:transposase-like protein
VYHIKKINLSNKTLGLLVGMTINITTTNKKVRYSYSLAAKRSILGEAYAEPRSVKRVAQKYSVQPNQLCQWKQHADSHGELGNDPSIPSSCSRRLRRVEFSRKLGAGRKSTFSAELIADLKVFFEKRRHEDFSVSLRLMVAQAKLLSPESTLGVSTRALESRIYRLLQKWDVTWRRGTHKAQNTRHNVEIQSDYNDYIQMKTRILGVDFCNVYNTDETNMYFSPQPTSTYAPPGSRTVSIKGADSSSRCTVMLGASMAGKKLPPFLIFRGKNERTGHIKQEIARKEGYPEEMEYSVQERAWMDEALMLEVINKIWRPATLGNSIKYLILDECRSHLTVAVRKALADCNTEVDLVPGGYTSKLQPMDVGLNKPFKGYVSDNVTDWLIVNRNKKPTRQDVLAWIYSGWNRLSEQIVIGGAGYIKVSGDNEVSHVDRLIVDELCSMEPSDVERSDHSEYEDNEKYEDAKNKKSAPGGGGALF